MNVFFALYKKRPSFFILVSILLSLAVFLLTTGATMLSGSIRQTFGISESYVTIAIPTDQTGIPENLKNSSEEDLLAYFNSIDIVAAHSAALRSGYVQSVDHRYVLGAEVKGSKAITSGALNIMNYDSQFDNPCYNMAVFAVRCNSIKEKKSYDFMGNTIAGYEMEATIENTISLAEAYPDISNNTAVISEKMHSEDESLLVPKTITIQSILFTPQGEIPFHEGQTYLIYGFYQDFIIGNLLIHNHETEKTTEVWGRVMDYGRKLSFVDYLRSATGAAYSVYSPDDYDGIDTVMETKHNFKSGGVLYYYPSEKMLPRWAEYSGSLEEYLASDEGLIWRETIIPLCEINQSSATVLLSDNIQSMYVFNTNQGGLLAGRFFDAEDYSDGNAVCMISAAYAQYNGYRIGDKLTLDFYDAGFYNSDTIPRGPCLPENRIDVTGEYEIVGIYSAPEFSKSTQLICADTILIPKKSIPGVEEFKLRSNSALLYSLILENGKQEEFKAYMEQEGFDNVFLYFDQGYSTTEVSLETITENAMRILWIGLAALMLTASLTHFLTVRRFSLTAKTMRILGVDRKAVRKQTLGAFLVIDALAAVLGGVLAIALFSKITEKTFAHALAPDPRVIIGCSGAIFLLLALTSLLCAKLLSNKPLMQTGRNRIKQG